MTITMQVLTAIIVVIGLRKVALMTDPIITSYSHRMSAQQREDLGGVKFADYDFNLLVLPVVFNRITYEESNHVPEDIMRLVAITDKGDQYGTFDVVDMLPCQDVLPEKYIQEGQHYNYLPFMHCLDPEKAVTQGFSDFQDDGESKRLIYSI